MISIIRSIKKILARIIYKILSTTYAENFFITCSDRIDGIGAQVQAILSTMLAAQELQLVYVHTPFKKIEHKPAEFNKSGKNWETEWEHFFNLGEGEMTISDIKTSSLSIIHINSIIKLRKRSNTLYVVPHCHDFSDINPNRYLGITDRLIKKYRGRTRVDLKKNYKLFYEKGKINIAIHIRKPIRGDENNGGKRYTGNLYYKFLLYELLPIFDDINVDIAVHVYSLGSVSDFSELKEFNLNYHLNECLFTTFFNLTSSDILIMAKSSFSYSAAILSKSIKIYDPFWHKPLDDWIVTDWHCENNKVIFDKSKLKKRVHDFLI